MHDFVDDVIQTFDTVEIEDEENENDGWHFELIDTSTAEEGEGEGEKEKNTIINEQVETIESSPISEKQRIESELIEEERNEIIKMHQQRMEKIQGDMKKLMDRKNGEEPRLIEIEKQLEQKYKNSLSNIEGTKEISTVALLEAESELDMTTLKAFQSEEEGNGLISTLKNELNALEIAISKTTK